MKTLGRFLVLLTALFIAFISFIYANSDIPSTVQIQIVNSNEPLYVDLLIDKELTKNVPKEYIEDLNYDNTIKNNLSYLQNIELDGKVAMGLNGINKNWYDGYVCNLNSKNNCEISIIIKNIKEAGLIIMNNQQEILTIDHLNHLYRGNEIKYDMMSKSMINYYSDIIPYIFVQMLMILCYIIYRIKNEKVKIKLIDDFLIYLCCVFSFIFSIVINIPLFHPAFLFILIPFIGYILQSYKNKIAIVSILIHLLFTLLALICV